jgi:hypothetical protein
MNKRQKPGGKILMLRNLIADYSTQDFERGKQQGFIPMLIVFLLLIAAVIYLAFTQVLNHQK